MAKKIFLICKRLVSSILFIHLSLSLLTVSTLAQTRPKVDDDSHLTKAQEAILAKKYDNAEDEVRLSLKQNPTSVKANLVLAKIYRYKTKWREAFQTVFEVLRLEPEFLEARVLLAQLYYETEEIGQAKKELEVAFKQGVNIPEAHALKAYIALDEENFSVALVAFESAVTLSQRNDRESLEWRLKYNFLKSNRECRVRNKIVANTEPQILGQINLNYPKEARKNKVEGSVDICTLVDEKGKVISWDLLTHLGYGTEEAAIKELINLEFIPAMKTGKPIPYWTTVEFIFRLP